MKARMGLLARPIARSSPLAPATAGAQEPAGLTQVVPVTGTSKSGKQFSGSYAIDRFRTSRATLVAVGTLRGRLGQRRVRARSEDACGAVGGATARAAQLPPIPNACEILDLVLGPINLDLLGLVVRTNRINVRIDAVPGPGNLLGTCSARSPVCSTRRPRRRASWPPRSTRSSRSFPGRAEGHPERERPRRCAPLAHE